ncbi:MAG: hypothetical protein JW940_01475 [Polyangiaceae bacterium]|nr:hypothetical protein [Polyangiaceae bacterium]
MRARSTNTKAAVALLGSALAFDGAVGCGRTSEDRLEKSAERSVSGPEPRPSRSVSAPEPRRPASFVEPGPSAESGSDPVELITRPLSAYATELVADDDALYLLSDKVVFRLVPGNKPLEISVDHGAAAALTRSAIVYWSDGAIRQVPKLGGKSRRVARVPNAPVRMAASGKDFVWLEEPSRGQFEIRTLRANRPRGLVLASGKIEAMTMASRRVVFVERQSRSAWRFGSVPVAGGSPTYSAPKSGRTPAMLAASGGDICYYDGNQIEVRRLAPDLSHEQSVANVICSPIAVSSRIYCAAFEGIFEIPEDPSATPRKIHGRARDVTSIASNGRFVAWTRDIGGENLSVVMLSLPIAPSAEPSEPARPAP